MERNGASTYEIIGLFLKRTVNSSAGSALFHAKPQISIFAKTLILKTLFLS